MLLHPDQSFLLIVDVQERLAPAIHGIDVIVPNINRLMRAAQRLNIPVRILEENPEGLGHTVAEVAKAAESATVLEKMYFSCAREPACMASLKDLQRHQVVVAGTETHVCVLQSALGLKAEGYQPFVIADASSSRRTSDHEAGLRRMRDAGCAVVTTEMVLFEWLERAGTQDFRDVLKIIR